MALGVALAQLVQIAALALRPRELGGRAPARRADERAQRRRDAVRVVIARDAEPEQGAARRLARAGVELAVLGDARMDAPRPEPRVEHALEGLDVHALHRRGREPEGARLLVGVLRQRAVVVVGAAGAAERDQALAQHRAQAIGLGAVRPDLRRQLRERRRHAGRGRSRTHLDAHDPRLDVLDGRLSWSLASASLSPPSSPTVARVLASCSSMRAPRASRSSTTWSSRASSASSSESRSSVPFFSGSVMALLLVTGRDRLGLVVEVGLVAEVGLVVEVRLVVEVGAIAEVRGALVDVVPEVDRAAGVGRRVDLRFSYSCQPFSQRPALANAMVAPAMKMASTEPLGMSTPGKYLAASTEMTPASGAKTTGVSAATIRFGFDVSPMRCPP